jgi:hypothetical protein
MNPNGALEPLKLRVGESHVIALAYADGKPVRSQYTGDQLMFTLVDGRKYYAEPYVQQRFDAADVQVGVPFEICKRETFTGNRRVVDVHVRKIEASTASLAPASSTDKKTATPQPSAPPANAPAPAAVLPMMNGAGETAADIMKRHYLTAIDVALVAVEAAQAKGLRITPCFEDIRTMAAVLFIDGARR